MAKFAKPVDRLVPSSERAQVFTDADVSSGDILDILKTLGGPANKVVIETSGGSDLKVRRNVVRKIYPVRGDGVFDGPLHGQNLNLAQGVEKIDNSMEAQPVGTDEIITGPVNDLEVTWTIGNWTIVVS